MTGASHWVDGDVALKDLIDEQDYAAKVNYVGIDPTDRRGLGALLVRPDGIVAWIAEERLNSDDLQAAKNAFQGWVKGSKVLCQ